MKRRGLLAAAGAVAGGYALSGCVKSSTQTSGTDGQTAVTVLISADTNIQDLWQKSLIPGFTAEHGDIAVNINFDLHGEHDTQNLAKLSASVSGKTDPGFDLIDGGFVSQAAQAKLLVPQSASTLPALAGVPETLVTQGGGAGVPYRASSVLLAYDTRKVDTPPATLADLLAWISGHPGRFAYNSPKSGGSGGAFVTTVLDANMSEDAQQKMRTSYDKELEKGWDAGFAVLKSLNSSVYGKGVYPNGNAQVLELLASGEIDMAPVWSDQFLTGQKNGQIADTVKVAQISDPTFTGSGSYLGLAASSQHTDAAQKLLEYVLSPAAQAIIANDIAGYPVIPLTELPEEVQKRFADAKPDELRPGYFSEFSNDMNNLWDSKVPG
jgi:putative spermidine/putrescine transport system substrate-binding protein